MNVELFVTPTTKVVGVYFMATLTFKNATFAQIGAFYAKMVGKSDFKDPACEIGSENNPSIITFRVLGEKSVQSLFAELGINPTPYTAAVADKNISINADTTFASLVADFNRAQKHDVVNTSRTEKEFPLTLTQRAKI